MMNAHLLHIYQNLVAGLTKEEFVEKYKFDYEGKITYPHFWYDWYCFVTRKDILEKEYTYVDEYRNYHAIVYKNGKVGIIDDLGAITVPIIYKSISRGCDIVMVTNEENKHGCLSVRNDIIFPFEDKPLELYNKLYNDKINK